MEQSDIRWKQRFGNFNKALTQLSRFIEKGNLNESRIKSSHTYNEEIAEEICKAIQNSYFELFIAFKTKIEYIRLNLLNDFNSLFYTAMAANNA